MSYREEARKLAALPESVPAPRLRWLLDDDWVVLGMDYVEGRNPGRPWRQADLDACLDACEVIAAELTPAPDGLALDTIADEFADMVGFWDHIRATQPGLPHLEEAAALAGAFADVAAGDTVVHTDLRDDNFLIGADGTVWMCDWNWPVLGADWVDSLFTLVGPRGDGLDVDPVIAARPAAARRTPRAHRHHAGAAGGLLLPAARRAGPPELPPHPRPPVLAGRGLLGLALRAPRLGIPTG